ncbi:MAG: efflux RND transporter periplasmic adaptor subunit [Phycisphaerales bacterium]|nr:efflux RND transporter periplasmic adaptor subunit [Phycisphaerales bacterium]
MNFTTPPTKLGRIVSLCVRVAVVCILLASATGILLWLTANRRVPSSSDPAAPDRSVEVVSVAPRGVARTWVGYGVAEAVNTVDVPSEVSSIVIEIPDSIDIGRTIMAGDLIAQLDSEDFAQQSEIARRSLQELATRKERLDLDEAIADEQLELSESDVTILLDELERVQSANALGAATRREIDLVRQRLNQARFVVITARERRDSIPLSRRLLETQEASQQFALELALRNVERCRILSPINGVLEMVNVEVGERVDPLARVARIVDPFRIVIPIRLPSSARASIQIGDEVRVQASGSIDRSWRGEIQRISPVDDQSTRTMTAFAEPIPDQTVDRALSLPAPGTFLSVSVVSSETQQRIVVPRSSVRNERIWFVDGGGQVVSMPVEIAFPLESSDGSERNLVLETLLPEGALVVIDGSRSPPPGTIVEPVLSRDSDPAVDDLP